MIIDLHCHYALTRAAAETAERFSFEPQPTGEPSAGGSVRPTDFDSCVSSRALARWSWRAARVAAGLPRPGPELDARLKEQYAQHLLAPGPIERFVLLAFDAVHDDDGGVPPLPETGARLGSDLYTSNTLIRALCRQHPQRFLFGASVHPYRPNAVACVEEVFAAGACLLKWLPEHHNIDVTDSRARAVLRACARLGLPLLVHYGEEFTLATDRPQFCSIRPLLSVLRELRRAGEMPTVIVAHAATPVLPWGDRDSHRVLLAALTGEFAGAPLYADISALATWAKAGYLRTLARRPELHARLLFGSDFPVPPMLGRLRGLLGSEYRAIAAERSWPQRAARACRAAGFGEIVFHRAAEMLPNVHHFADGRPGNNSASSAGPPSSSG